MPFVGLVGKLPTRGDFVRHNLGSPAAQALDQWVREAHEVLTRNRVQPPATPLRFIFSDGGSEHVLVGALRASRDQVGRAYPLLAFGAVPAHAASTGFPGLHGAFEAFLDDVGELLAASETLQAEQLIQRLEAMALPDTAAVEQARTAFEQAATRMLVTDFHERLFGDDHQEQQLYAYSTFLAACDAVRQGYPSKPGTVLDCPYVSSVDLFVWLDLARRVLRWPHAPTAFWTEHAPLRLLLSLGRAPSRLLEFVTDPDTNAQRLWPLRTSRPAAVDAARNSLGTPLQRFGAGSEASVGELLQTLEARAG